MKKTISWIPLCLSIYAASASSGLCTDALAKCLVDSTSVRDRTELVKWMFAAASLHPAVKSVVSVSQEQLNDANRRAADLFTRLLTDSCKKEAKEALTYEGEATLQLSFQVLGQVAGRELFASPEVGKAMSDFEKYLDEDKFKSLMQRK